MGVASFYLPESIDEIVTLLNEPCNESLIWNITIHNKNEKIWIVTGDQLSYIAVSQGELLAFLAGCFLATFNGADKQRIQEMIHEGRLKLEHD